MIYFSLFLFIFFLFFPVDIALSAREGLNLCLTTVIPSLFPFMVLSKIIASYNFKDNFLFKVISKIFSISKNGSFVFLIGLLCGYPMGAKAIKNLEENNKISKSEREKLFLFSNNAGPSFVIGTLGGMLLKSIKAGIIIYFSNLISVFLIGIFLRNIKIADKKSDYINNKKPLFSHIFTEALRDSVKSILNVSGIIIFFFAFIKIFDFFYFLPSFIKGIFTGFFEITSALGIIAKSDILLYLKIALSSFFTSFGGISVFFQISSICPNYNIRLLIIFKFITGVIAFFISYIISLILL